MIRKTKKTKTKNQIDRAECDKLWSEAVKLRAGYRSEYSGTRGTQIGGDKVLNAHHILTKPNFTLRYSLENGICLTAGEHHFIAHGNYKQAKKFRDFIGEERLQRLEDLLHVTVKADYKAKKEELYKFIKELKEKK